MTSLTSLSRSVAHAAQATLHYVDQPHVVQTLQKAAWPVGIAATGIAGIPSIVQSDDPNRALVKRGIVTGAAMAGTAIAAHRFNFAEVPAVKTLTRDTVDTLAKTLGEDVAKLAEKPQKSWGQMKQLVTQLSEATHLSPAQRQKLKAAVLPPPELEENAMEEVQHFLKLGAASIGSGLAGGVLANKVTGEKSQLPAQLKEALFQMGVNIGMCGVGAAAGIKAAETLGFASKRFPRLGCISAGLTAGIAGGNLVSGVLEKTVVDPLAKASGHPELVAEPARKVGGTDLAMHADDAPLALMFAGMDGMKPIIPQIFAYSGIKTGLATSQSVTAQPSADRHKVTETSFSGQATSIDRNTTHPAFQSFNAVG